MTRDDIRDIAAHVMFDVEFYGRACKLRAEGETVNCSLALEHVNLGVGRMEDEITRLRAENERLKADAELVGFVREFLAGQKSLPPELDAKMAELWHTLYE